MNLLTSFLNFQKKLLKQIYVLTFPSWDFSGPMKQTTEMNLTG